MDALKQMEPFETHSSAKKEEKIGFPVLGDIEIEARGHFVLEQVVRTISHNISACWYGDIQEIFEQWV